MPKQGQTIAQANRAIRQEGLREVLSNQKHIEKVVDNIIKIESLDHTEDSFNNHINKLKIANEQRLRLINKYLPDLKNVELANDGGGELTITTINYKDA